MLNNEVDAAIASNISGQAQEAEASPRGIVYPATPAADKAGWERLRKVGALLRAAQGDLRRRASAEAAARAAELSVSDLHGLREPVGRARARHHQGDDRELRRVQGRRARRRGLELSRQNLAWVLPYHEGAVEGVQGGRASGRRSTRRTTSGWSSASRCWPRPGARSSRPTRRVTTPPSRKGWIGARAAKALESTPGMDVIFELVATRSRLADLGQRHRRRRPDPRPAGRRGHCAFARCRRRWRGCWSAASAVTIFLCVNQQFVLRFFVGFTPLNTEYYYALRAGDAAVRVRGVPGDTARAARSRAVVATRCSSS